MMMKQLSWLNLGVFVCFITLSCSFQLRFVQFGLRRQNLKGPAADEKTALAQRWRKTVSSNVQSREALSPSNAEVVKQVDSARGKATYHTRWSDDEIATLRSLVKNGSAEFQIGTLPNQTVMWQNIGLQLGRTAMACSNKYIKEKKIDPTYGSVGRARWSDDEITTLRSLVKTHNAEIQNGTFVNQTVMWQNIGLQLGRTAMACNKKYVNGKKVDTTYTPVVRARWSDNEIATLQAQVKSYYDKRQAIRWQSIGQQLGRTAQACINTYYSERKDDPTYGPSLRTKWLDDETATLQALVKTHYEALRGEPNASASTSENASASDNLWQSIGLQLGRTPRACFQQYSSMERKVNRTRKVSKWSDDEIATLLEFVNNHKEKFWGEPIEWHVKRETFMWQDIGLQLGRTAMACCAKYWKERHLADQSIGGEVKVEFTEKQDALLLRLAEEWGGFRHLNRTAYRNISKDMDVTVKALMTRCRELQGHVMNPVERLRNTAPAYMTRWNATLDARLTEAVREIGSKKNCWGAVAERVGSGVDWWACQRRWRTYLRYPELYPNTAQPWTEPEVAQLWELVQERRDLLEGTNREEKASRLRAWKDVGAKLGRTYKQCVWKWKREKLEKNVFFSSEEDALILQIVKEWGAGEKGMWGKLQKELNRDCNSVRSRWLTLLGNQKRVVRWTEEMNAALVATHDKIFAEKGSKKWARVLESMQEQGWPVTTIDQCIHKHFALKAEGGEIDPEWTPELVASVCELREKGVNWAEIGRTLNKPQRSCRGKWETEKDKVLKRGPCTPEEDELIEQAVAGRSGAELEKGFWKELGERIGRPRSLLRCRWYLTLYPRTLYRGTVES